MPNWCLPRKETQSQNGNDTWSRNGALPSAHAFRYIPSRTAPGRLTRSKPDLCFPPPSPHCSITSPFTKLFPPLPTRSSRPPPSRYIPLRTSAATTRTRSRLGTTTFRRTRASPRWPSTLRACSGCGTSSWPGRSSRRGRCARASHKRHCTTLPRAKRTPQPTVVAPKPPPFPHTALALPLGAAGFLYALLAGPPLSRHCPVKSAHMSFSQSPPPFSPFSLSLTPSPFMSRSQGSATCYQIISHKNVYSFPRDNFCSKDIVRPSGGPRP